MKQIPKYKFETDHDILLMSTCQNVAMVLFWRCKNDRKSGLKYLSDVARYLDCKLDVKITPEELLSLIK